MNKPNPPDPPEVLLPKEVVAYLREREDPGIAVPGDIDAAILAGAKQHLDSKRGPISVRPGKRRWMWAALSTGAVAAALLLMAVLPEGRQPQNERSFASQEMAPSASVAKTAAVSRDIDLNGTIDILDAFALARAVDGSSTDALQWDQNGDGRTDQDDVKLVALQAVML